LDSIDLNKTDLKKQSKSASREAFRVLTKFYVEGSEKIRRLILYLAELDAHGGSDYFLAFLET